MTENTASIKNKPSFLAKLLSIFIKKTPVAKTVYIDGVSASASASSSSVSPAVTEAIGVSAAATVVQAKTPVVVNLTTDTNILTTNTTLAEVFAVDVTQSVIIDCTNGVDGKGTTWLLTQGSGGSKTITLGDNMILPSSASVLSFSTAAGKTDILAARYSSALGKWLVVSMVPGY